MLTNFQTSNCWLHAFKFRSSHSEVFLGKGVPKICNKFTREHRYWSAISIKLQSNFIEIALRHGCSVNLLHIFRTPFQKNTSEWLLLKITRQKIYKFNEFRWRSGLFSKQNPNAWTFWYSKYFQNIYFSVKKCIKLMIWK